MRYYTYIDSPVDPLLLVSDGTALTRLHMQTQRHAMSLSSEWRRDPALFTDVIAQLRAYFAGETQSFDVSLRLEGTIFQQRVWQALREIPYGETRSYKDIALRIGAAAAVRAVGLANGRNPVGIIVPCHRVIGASGALTGYAGGLPRKRWLLQHEATHRREFQQTDWLAAPPPLGNEELRARF